MYQSYFLSRLTHTFFLSFGLFVLLGGVMLLNVRSVHAEACIFDGSTDADFNTDDNWDCGHTPTGADSATIPNGQTATMDADATVGSLTVGTGATGVLNINASVLTVSGAAAIAAGGTVTITSGGLNVGTTITNTGTLSLGSGNATSTGAYTANTAGTTDLGSGRLAVGGNLALNASTFTRGTGTIRFVGSGDRTVAPSTHATANNTYFHNIEVLKSGGSLTWSGSTTTILGYFNASSTGSTITDFASANASIVGNASIGAYEGLGSFSSGDVRFLGAVSSSGMIAGVSGTFFFGSTFINNGTFDVGSGMATTTGNVTSTAGSTMIVDGLLTVMGDLDLTSAIFTRQTGTIRFAGGATQDIRPSTHATANNTYFNNVTSIKTGGEVQLSNSANTSTILGYFTASSTAASGFLYGSLDLSIVGNVSLAANNTLGTPSDGDLRILGAVTSSGEIASVSGNLYFGSTFINNGSLDFGSGFATSTGNVTSTANSIFEGSGVFSIQGNLDLTSATAEIDGNAVLRFVGGADQDIRPSTNASAPNTYLPNLQSIKTGGTVSFSNSANTSTVTGYFTATSTAATTYNFGNMNLAVVGVSLFNANSTVTSTLGNMSFIGAVGSAGAIGTVSGDKYFGDSLTNTGTIHLGSGTATSTSSIGNSGTFSLGTGTLSLATGSNFTNYATFTPGTGTVRFASGSPVINLGGSYIYNFVSIQPSGTGVISGASTTILGTFTSTGAGTVSIASNAVTIVGATTIVTGTVTSTSGTLVFSGAVTSTGSIGSVSGNLSFGSTLQNNGTLNLGSGNATTTGTLTNAASGTINANSATYALGGNFVNTGTFNRGTSTVKYTGGPVVDVAAVNYHQVQFLGSGTYSLTASTTASATTTIASGATLAVLGFTFNAPGDISNSGLMSTSTGGTIVHPVDLVLVTDTSGTLVSSITSPGSLFVTVRDANRNVDGSVQETMSVAIATDSSAGSDSETLTLTETTASSGIFRNASAMSVTAASVSTSDGTLQLSGSGSGTASYVDTGDSTSTSVTLTYYVASSGGSGGGGGGGGGGIGGLGFFLPSIAPVFPVATTTLPTVPPAPINPVPPSTPSPAPILPPVVVPEVGDREALLRMLGLSPDPAAEQRGLSGVRNDAREFRVAITDTQAQRLSLFIAYGMSSETRRLGEGERRALIRDMLETMQNAQLSTEDMQRLTIGQIPQMRNLTVERQQLPRVRATFRTLYGHDPDFQNAEENMAWNTLMYRIRFPRNLTDEQRGIREFREVFGRSPATPFQWATVRVMGYVQR